MGGLRGQGRLYREDLAGASEFLFAIPGVLLVSTDSRIYLQVSEDSWDRTLPACTRFPDPANAQLACPINRETSCTQDACGPRRPLPMDHTRIFVGETKNRPQRVTGMKLPNSLLLRN